MYHIKIGIIDIQQSNLLHTKSDLQCAVQFRVVLQRTFLLQISLKLLHHNYSLNDQEKHILLHLQINGEFYKRGDFRTHVF